MEGDKTKARPWLTISTFSLKNENINHGHNNGVTASKERLILVKTGLLQDFHCICYILRTQNIGGKNPQNNKRNKTHPNTSKIQYREKYRKE